MEQRAQMGLPATEPPRCVGRERELSGLEQLLGSAITDGRGRAAWVSGPAGIGKSRLLQELRRRLSGRGVLALEGRCREGARAFQPVIEILDGAVRALGELEGSGLAVVGAELALRLKDPVRELGADATSHDLRRLRLFEQVASFLGEASWQAPLLIAGHDLHLADAATRALFQHLVETRCSAPELGAPVEERLRGLIVFTSREPDPAWLDGQAALRVPLGALDAEGVRAFLQSPEVVRRVTEATGGQPRALEALMAATPATAEDLLAARTVRLSRDARLLLDALAVYGRPVPPEALCRAVAMAEHAPPASPARAVAELVEGGLVDKRVIEGELRLAFARSGDEETTLARLDPEARRALHRGVGRALLAGGDEGERVVAAEHLCRGEAGEEAVDAALVAGERLEAGFGHDRAIALYREAFRLTGRDEVRAVLEARLLELGRLTGDYDAALADAERVRKRRPDDAAVLRAIGQLHLLRDDYARAHETLALARERALAAGDDAELARIIAAVAETCLLDGRHADAVAECEIGLRATDAGRGGVEGARHRLEIRNTLGKVHLAEGRYDVAERHFADNLAEARGLGVAFEEARALINQGIARLRLGDESGAAECYQASLKVADAAGDHRHRAFCLQNLGVLAHWRNQFGAALGHFQQAAAAFRKIGQRGRIAWVALDLASLYLDLGATERAQAMAALGERLFEPRTAAAVRLKREIIAGRLARLAGDVDTARERLRTAQRAAGTSNPEFQAEATLQLAWLELESGDARVASALVESVIAGAASTQVSHATRARAQLLEGEIALSQAHVEARRPLVEASETFHRLGDLDGEWRAQFALSRAATLAGDHAEADRRLRRASLLDARLRERVPEEFQAAFAADAARRGLSRALADLAPARTVTPPSIRPAEPPRASTAEGPLSGDRYLGLIGRSPRMRQIYALVEKVARHQSVVLIRGESGTGKELIADAIHARSARAGRPLVKVNCGALVESLLLSELFGHERGAFTGAIQRKKGRFEAAHQGTIFLDEIGDISPATQTALLRVIQEREFERVGSTTPIKVDVRIICATNRNLEQMVERGEFREDLYYRLNGIQIELPPLRERTGDIPLLVADLLRRLAEERTGPTQQLDDAAMDRLQRYRWPGNVRELENVIRSVSLLSERETLGLAELADHPALLRDEPERPAPASLVAEPRAPGETAASAWERLETEGLGLRELQARIEIECITRALAESRGNITRAAELLKMKRPRLSQLIKEHGIAL